jgi:hypothetical protein
VQRKKLDAEKLKNTEICTEYENRLSNNFKDLEERRNIEVEWKSITRIMAKVTKEVFSKGEDRHNEE